MTRTEEESQEWLSGAAILEYIGKIGYAMNLRIIDDYIGCFDELVSIDRNENTDGNISNISVASCSKTIGPNTTLTQFCGTTVVFVRILLRDSKSGILPLGGKCDWYDNDIVFNYLFLSQIRNGQGVSVRYTV